MGILFLFSAEVGFFFFFFFNQVRVLRLNLDFSTFCIYLDKKEFNDSCFLTVEESLLWRIKCRVC